MINADMLQQSNGEFQFTSTHFVSSAEKYSDPYLCIQLALVFRKEPDKIFAGIGIHINKEYIFEVSQSFVSIKYVEDNGAQAVLWQKGHKFQDQDQINLIVTKDRINNYQTGLKFQCKNLNGITVDVEDFTIPYKQDIQYGVYGTTNSKFINLVLKKRSPDGYELQGRVNVIENGFEIQDGQVQREQSLRAGVYRFNCTYTNQPQFLINNTDGPLRIVEKYAKNHYTACFFLERDTDITIRINNIEPTAVFDLKLHQIGTALQDELLESFLLAEGGSTSKALSYTMDNLDLQRPIGIGFDIMGLHPSFSGVQQLFSVSNKLNISFVHVPTKFETSFYVTEDNQDAKYGDEDEVYARYGDEFEYYLNIQRNSNIGALPTLRIPLDNPNRVFQQHWYNKLFFNVSTSNIEVYVQSTPCVKVDNGTKIEDYYLYLVSDSVLAAVDLAQTGVLTTGTKDLIEYELITNGSDTYIRTSVPIHAEYVLFEQQTVTSTYAIESDNALTLQEELKFFIEDDNSDPTVPSKYEFLADNIVVLNNENNLADYQNFSEDRIAYKLYTTFDDQVTVNRISVILDDINPIYPIQCVDGNGFMYTEVYSTFESNLLQRKKMTYTEDKIEIGDWTSIQVLTADGEPISFLRYGENSIYLTNHSLVKDECFYIYFVLNKSFCVDIIDEKPRITIVNPTGDTRIQYVALSTQEAYLHHINLNPFVADANNGFIYIANTNNVQQLDIRTNKYVLKADGKDTAFITVKCLGSDGSSANNFNIECSTTDLKVKCEKYTSVEEKESAEVYAHALRMYGTEYAAQFKNLVYSDVKQSAQEVFIVQALPFTGSGRKECNFEFKDTISGTKSIFTLEITR